MTKQNKGHKKLKIYQQAHDLAIQVHKMTFNLPKHEMYEEGSQIRRSAKDISSRIVEGYALRKYKNEYLHHLYRAYGSCEETIEHLLNLKDTGSLTDEDILNELENSYGSLDKMLFNFIISVEEQHETPNFIKNIKQNNE
jgi:four helix bundle protein